MINLQRQENESLEEHYTAMEQIYHRTEKENLKLINIKESFISCLDQIIKKLDSGIYNMTKSLNNYSDNNIQNLRTDLVNIFQIVLNHSDNEFDNENDNDNEINNGEEIEIKSGYKENNINNIIINNNLNKAFINNDDLNKKKSSNKNVKNLSWKKIEDSDNYYKNTIKSSNTTVKFPMSNNNRQLSKKENTSNAKIIHGHNESTGSEHYKNNNNYNNKKETIKNIKIKVVQKK
jgi:hypothetical protein